jgi:hypothetical protein
MPPLQVLAPNKALRRLMICALLHTCVFLLLKLPDKPSCSQHL